jgi:hypothetical protein
MARPKKDIDPRLVKRLAGAGLSVEEVAAVLECSKRTLETRFCAALKEGRTRRNARLRLRQFQAAMAGSVPMLMWLGKQYLGRRDRVANEHSGPDGKGFEVHLYLPDNGREANPEAEPPAVEQTDVPALQLGLTVRRWHCARFARTFGSSHRVPITRMPALVILPDVESLLSQYVGPSINPLSRRSRHTRWIVARSVSPTA